MTDSIENNEQPVKNGKSKVKKILAIVSAVVVLLLAAFIFFHFFFVYSTGINAGEINYFQREGVLFKTYEGKMIQSGFHSVGKAGAVSADMRSNEFKFSVTDDTVAERLMRCSGKHVELKWKRFMGTLPWRGNSQYVVTEVVSVE